MRLVGAVRRIVLALVPHLACIWCSPKGSERPVQTFNTCRRSYSSGVMNVMVWSTFFPTSSFDLHVLAWGMVFTIILTLFKTMKRLSAG